MRRPLVRWAGVLVLVWSASFSFPLSAQQPRTARDGVYAAAQVGRGEATYQTRCVACHGATLGGNAGPPLAGDEFLGVWGTQPLSDLVGKILNTMPADAPGSLTRPQAADLVAFLLQTNHFPAGRVELDAADVSLKQVSMGAIGTVPPPGAAAPAASFPATGSLNQVMRGILFPSSNVLFDVQTRDPGGRQASGARGDATTTSARYGDVYDPWMVVDAAAISLAEAAPLLMTRGRRCENGKPAPVDRADWQQYVQGLVEAGRAAYRASQTRNQAVVSEVTNQISDACANCHRVYRDRPTAAMRCTPP